MPDPLPIARHGDLELDLLPALANRHGLITGATGTGKTVTLQVIAERMSGIGVPVFMADVKGDLAGMSQAGAMSPKLAERLQTIGAQAPDFKAMPVVFWDVFGEQGHPVRATVSDLGPLLLARILALNETQQGVLALVFKFADDNGLLLLDLKDLRALLQYTAGNAQSLQTSYGNISAASVGAIQRALLALEQQGGDRFLGEPMLNIDDLLQTDGGRGSRSSSSSSYAGSAPGSSAAVTISISLSNSSATCLIPISRSNSVAISSTSSSESDWVAVRI